MDDAAMLETREFELQHSVAAALHDKFNQGVELHQQGKLTDAERIYGDVLQRQPNHFGALHLLGVIALQARQAERAVELIEKAIGVNANIAAAHCNLGKAFLDLGRPQEALECVNKAIAIEPDFALAHNNRGNALLDLKRPVEALASCEKAIALKPDLAEAHNNRGLALWSLKCAEEALASFDKAIAVSPNIAKAHYNRGNVLQELKQPDEALSSYDRAIALNPDYAEAHNARGNALGYLKRHEDALASYERAIALNPDYAEAYNNRGILLEYLSYPEKALASYDKAIAMKSNYATAYSNRGLALRDLNRLEEALASCDKAIALNSDFAEAHWNKSLCLLKLGHFDQGWLCYEWRKKCKTIAPFSFHQSLWLGEEDISAKIIFLWWEQGLGDTIQFCRYAKLIEARGAKVVMSVQQPLHQLLKCMSPTIEIVNQDEVPDKFDYHCPLMSLPLAFKTTLSTIPAEIPYIKSNKERLRFWESRLGPKSKLRVGLVWSGGFRPDQPELWAVNRRRNLPLAKLAPLKHPDIDFFSLQKGRPAEAELAELRRNKWNGPDMIDLTSELSDFSDTAALAENLDLIISVDTAMAHLAGAIGKKVWILNRFDSDWRWLLDRTDTPWYPTAKIFRQHNAGDWDDVVQRVKADLFNTI